MGEKEEHGLFLGKHSDFHLFTNVQCNFSQRYESRFNATFRVRTYMSEFTFLENFRVLPRLIVAEMQQFEND